MGDNDCGTGGFCSMNQEDTDGDCIGDVCDTDPDDPNYPDTLIDSDTDGIGDACDNCSDEPNPNQENGDSDLIGDICDNCPNDFNPTQEDNYPPQGNEIGNACDCEGNFDCDEDCDGTDAATFKADFGRSIFSNPCETGNTCNGDFDCDGDCDGTDAAGFKVDFGRSSFNNPCPACVVGEWCSY